MSLAGKALKAIGLYLYFKYSRHSSYVEYNDISTRSIRSFDNLKNKLSKERIDLIEISLHSTYEECLLYLIYWKETMIEIYCKVQEN